MSSDGEHPKHWTNLHEQTLKSHDYMQSLAERAKEAMETWRSGNIDGWAASLKAWMTAQVDRDLFSDKHPSPEAAVDALFWGIP